MIKNIKYHRNIILIININKMIKNMKYHHVIICIFSNIYLLYVQVLTYIDSELRNTRAFLTSKEHGNLSLAARCFLGT